MNENLNLADILRDCPRYTKLYSTVHGEVEFIGIRLDEDYPIKYRVDDKNYKHVASVSLDGKYYSCYEGECTLFPSKNQRDWSKFNIEPKFDIKTLQHFDKVLGRDNDSSKWRCDFFSHIGDTHYKFICTGTGNNYVQCIPYNDETKYLVGTTKMPPEKYITWRG